MDAIPPKLRHRRYPKNAAFRAPRARRLSVFFVVSPPSKSKQRPAVLHIHGGGYIIGSAADSVPNMRRLAEQLDAVVITVEYRLAPKTKYPGSLEDNYAALKWVHANAEELGIDRTRIALLGESAGGGHAAALSIAARDRGDIPSLRKYSSIRCWMTVRVASETHTRTSERLSGRENPTISGGPCWRAPQGRHKSLTAQCLHEFRI